MNRKILSAAVAIACATALPAAYATNGYMSHAYSPHAKGMAGAGEAALPQDSLSIVGNPAGLTRVGQRADVGLSWFVPQRGYKGTDLTDMTGVNIAPIGSTPFGGEVDSRHTNFFIPNFGYTHQIDDVSAVGVAVFGNGGMNTQYSSADTFGRLGTYGGNNARPTHPSLGFPGSAVAMRASTWSSSASPSAMRATLPTTSASASAG